MKGMIKEEEMSPRSNRNEIDRRRIKLLFKNNTTVVNVKLLICGIRRFAIPRRITKINIPLIPLINFISIGLFVVI